MKGERPHQLRANTQLFLALSVRTVRTLWTRHPKNCSLIPSRGQDIYLFSKVLIAALRPTQSSIQWVKVKVKCTLVQALRLCAGRTAHRGSRGIALLFFDQRH